MESEKLNYNSSKEDFEGIQKLKTELYNKLIGSLDDKIENIPALKSMAIHHLFDKIYSSEKLDPITIQDIQKVRSEKKQFKWYERKVIINAISLSLVGYKKFDQNKAHILIDFLTDFEENVWEHALAGLILPLMHHQNKWDKFESLRNRLEPLKDHSRVQAAIRIIDYILLNKLYMMNDYNSSLYSNALFNNISNCFMPFYDDNPVFSNALENNASDIDLEYFTNYINDLPFLDCHKYALCVAVSEGLAKIDKLDRKTALRRMNNLKMAAFLDPFQNIISEYFCFFKYYPKNRIEDVFKNQLSIAKTKLRTLILNKTNELNLVASSLVEDGKYNEALVKLLELYKIDNENFNCLWQLSTCYLHQKEPNFREALKCLHKLNELSENDVVVIERIAQCYSDQAKYKEAIDYYSKCLEKGAVAKSIYIGIADCYIETKQVDLAITQLLNGEKIYNEDRTIDEMLIECFIEKKDYESTSKYLLKGIDNDDVKFKAGRYRRLAVVYEGMNDLEKSKMYAEQSYELQSKDVDTIMTLARAYLLSNEKLDIVESLLNKALRIEPNDGVCYGNLGHMYLVRGNREFALDNYKKCIKSLNDANDFKERCESDLSYIVALGVEEKEYSNTIDYILDWFNNLQTS